MIPRDALLRDISFGGGGALFGKIFFRPLCGAGGESSSEFLDRPLWTGLSRAPLSRPPVPPPHHAQTFFRPPTRVGDGAAHNKEFLVNSHIAPPPPPPPNDDVLVPCHFTTVRPVRHLFVLMASLLGAGPPATSQRNVCKRRQQVVADTTKIRQTVDKNKRFWQRVEGPPGNGRDSLFAVDLAERLRVPSHPNAGIVSCHGTNGLHASQSLPPSFALHWSASPLSVHPTSPWGVLNAKNKQVSLMDA